MKNKHLYIKVTNDKYELPLIVADTQRELAQKCGVIENSVIVGLRHTRNGKKGTYYDVVIEEDNATY